MRKPSSPTPTPAAEPPLDMGNAPNGRPYKLAENGVQLTDLEVGDTVAYWTVRGIGEGRRSNSHPVTIDGVTRKRIRVSKALFDRVEGGGVTSGFQENWLTVPDSADVIRWNEERKRTETAAQARAALEADPHHRLAQKLESCMSWGKLTLEQLETIDSWLRAVEEKTP